MKNSLRAKTKMAIAIGISCTALATHLDASPEADAWYKQGEQVVAQALHKPVNNAVGAARNVILFVGDGMGVSTLTAARIYAGQQLGLSGEEHQLSFEKFPYAGLVKTYNTNQQTADSAGTMTAIVSGVKSKAGFISVDETAYRGDCASSKGGELETLLDLAERAGKRTGVVSTARITHATPAALYAHVPERDWENDKELSAKAAAQGCTDIAAQLVQYDEGDGIDVVLGGGLAQFKDSGGKRGDDQDLVEYWQQRFPNGQVMTDAEQLASWDRNGKALGLFSKSHMEFHVDRPDNEPALSEMTAAAIQSLSRHKEGFFLMIESGRIDHGHHIGSAYKALSETTELAKAVALASSLTNDDDTLILVTADHSHVMTMAGYPTRGNPILGKVVGNDSRGEPENTPALASDDMPYTTLGYMNGKGFAKRSIGGMTGRYVLPGNTGRHDLADVDTTDANFHQEALIPTDLETHGGEDVAIYAKGPGAHLVSGNIEQHVIFHIINHAAGYRQLVAAKQTEEE